MAWVPFSRPEKPVNAASKTALSSQPAPRDAHRRDELILEHMTLVTAIAAHIQRSVPVHIELDDLVHAGVMGLFDAATKYRDDKEVAFPTYAKHRIRGAILDSLRQQDWASRDLRKRYKQMESVTRELTVKLGRTPGEVEIAAAMGLSSRRWQALMVTSAIWAWRRCSNTRATGKKRLPAKRSAPRRLRPIRFSPDPNCATNCKAP